MLSFTGSFICCCSIYKSCPIVKFVLAYYTIVDRRYNLLRPLLKAVGSDGAPETLATTSGSLGSLVACRTKATPRAGATAQRGGTQRCASRELAALASLACLEQDTRERDALAHSSKTAASKRRVFAASATEEATLALAGRLVGTKRNR